MRQAEGLLPRSASSSRLRASDDGARQSRMREAGMSALDAALSSKLAKPAPPGLPISTSTSSSSLNGRREKLEGREQQAENAELAQFGAFLEGNLVTALMVAYVVAQGASWVCMKSALLSMQTPGVMSFLHMLAAALFLICLSAYEVIQAPQISIAALKGSTVQAVTHGLQTFMVLGALVHGSTYMLLCWVVVVPLLLGMLYAQLSQRQPPSLAMLACAVVAIVGTVLEFRHDPHLAVLPFLWLVLWVLPKLAQLLWVLLKADATGLGTITDPEVVFRLREFSDAEDCQSPGTLALLSNALPSLPVLAMGLMCGEGSDLVEHEPSVPALSAMMLSSLAFAAAIALQVMLTPHLRPSVWPLLHATAAVAAIGFDFWEQLHTPGVVCLVGVTAAVGFTWLGHVSQIWELAGFDDPQARRGGGHGRSFMGALTWHAGAANTAGSKSVVGAW